MLLLPSDDFGNETRMSKAICSKGAPPLYSYSLLLERFLGPLRAVQGSHMRQLPRHSSHCSSRSAHELFVSCSNAPPALGAAIFLIVSGEVTSEMPRFTTPPARDATSPPVLTLSY
ncbi:hypothetical protein TNCV_3068741 [Trichonephila clavipes]|nr:hypothetical protein TNCV_3068741 [Trichonephila clavipes]